MEVQQHSSPNEHSALVIEMTNFLEGVDLALETRGQEKCIYRAPRIIGSVDQKAYIPTVLSIGPLHMPHATLDSSSDVALEPMEELKGRYLKSFLTRAQVTVGDLVSKLAELETRIRECYEEPIRCSSNNFPRMVLIDACFIVEHFLRCYETESCHATDPLSSTPWVFKELFYDLILMENQLPFFVLEEIYNFVSANFNHSFREVTFKYFKAMNFQNKKPEGIHPLHFTDLLRTFMLPLSDPETTERTKDEVPRHLYSATQLSQAGLTFEVSETKSEVIETKCLLDITFDDQKGIVKIPQFPLFDTTERLLRNIVTFEQCHYNSSNDICEYLVFLSFLMKTEKDVNILVDKEIIVNYMGDASRVADMFKNLHKP